MANTQRIKPQKRVKPVATDLPKYLRERVAFSLLDGQHLAVQMLHDFEATDADSCCLEEQYRLGKPQLNIVLGYLKTLAEMDSEQLTAGFTSVLSDYFSSCAGGAVPYAETYDNLLGKGVAPAGA